MTPLEIRELSASYLAQWKTKQLNLTTADFKLNEAADALRSWYEAEGVPHSLMVVVDPSQLAVMARLIKLVSSVEGRTTKPISISAAEFAVCFNGVMFTRANCQLLTAAYFMLQNLGMDPEVAAEFRRMLAGTQPWMFDPQICNQNYGQELRSAVVGILKLIRLLGLVPDSVFSNYKLYYSSIGEVISTQLSAAAAAKVDFICETDEPWLQGLHALPADPEANNNLKLAVAAVRANYYAVGLGGIVLICEPPQFLQTDANDRRHCEDGPAVLWAGGLREYYWHGVETTAKAVMTPELLTAEDVFAETNTEMRRVLIERMTWLKLLESVPSTLLDTRICQLSNTVERLYELTLQYSVNPLIRDTRRVFRVIDPSTLREYAMGVPNWLTTCEEAQQYINHGFDSSFISVS